MDATIAELIQQANNYMAIIENAFGNNGENLTHVINNNNNIAIEIGNINRLIDGFEAKITELFTELSNAKSDAEFQQLEQQIRAFLVRFNEIIPALQLNRFNGNISSNELTMATTLVTNIRNKAFAYVKRGPNYRGTNAEFTRVSDLVKGNYTREGNGMTFKNNENETRINFGLEGTDIIPNSIIVDGNRTDVVRAGMNFTTTINGNPYFLIAYSFDNIPRAPQIRGGGSKRRKRRRTRKNKRKSIAKKQKGGFNYNNKIPSSKKKSSKRTSNNSSSTSKTTSSSK
jgi:hypothetical protein